MPARTPGERRPTPLPPASRVAVLATGLALAACAAPEHGTTLPPAAAELPPVLVLPALLAGPDAFAAPGDGERFVARSIEVFRAADRNGDGRLEADEAEALVRARFAAADRDGDGRLDLAELGLDHLPPEAQTLPYDSDGDGRMSLPEQLAFMRTVLDATAGGAAPGIAWVDIDRRLVR